MDNRGIIITSDSIFSLIIIFIILATVTNISANKSGSQLDLLMTNKAQDTMELMVNYRDVSTNKTIIETVATELKISNNQKSGISNAGKVVGEFLNKTLDSTNYNLIEVNKLNGTIIASNADINQAKNISTAIRSYGGYTFRLYLWD
ncbi:MAG: hypothetical protein ACP5C3_06485 [Methanomicrobiales archaeon]